MPHYIGGRLGWSKKIGPKALFSHFVLKKKSRISQKLWNTYTHCNSPSPHPRKTPISNIPVVYPMMPAKHFLTAARANGMYERAYHASERYWIMAIKITITGCSSQNAAMSVHTIEQSIITVASRRFSSNIDFTCLTGPFKKHVPPSDVQLPRDIQIPKATKS